jgi:hypothetical protein
MTAVMPYTRRIREPLPRAYPKCTLCGFEWHGIETPACPGPFPRLRVACNATKSKTRKRRAR